MPHMCCVVTASTALVATAASAAEPPARSIARPASAARWSTAHTAPLGASVVGAGASSMAEDPNLAGVECTARFSELVGGPDHAIPLDETALLIAAHDHDVDVDRQLQRLDDVAGAVREPTIDELRRVLFVQHGLAGAADDYYAPENSFLDAVLDRGRGIPITLAVLMMEVGRRAGVAVHGIGAPGHFLVLHGDDLHDPFDGGRVVEGKGIHPSYLVQISRRALLGRMLANLRQIYQTSGAFTSLLWVMRLRCALPDAPDSDREELARMVASLN